MAGRTAAEMLISDIAFAAQPQAHCCFVHGQTFPCTSNRWGRGNCSTPCSRLSFASNVAPSDDWSQGFFSFILSPSILSPSILSPFLFFLLFFPFLAILPLSAILSWSAILSLSFISSWPSILALSVILSCAKVGRTAGPASSAAAINRALIRFSMLLVLLRL